MGEGGETYTAPLIKNISLLIVLCALYIHFIDSCDFSLTYMALDDTLSKNPPHSRKFDDHLAKSTNFSNPPQRLFFIFQKRQASNLPTFPCAVGGFSRIMEADIQARVVPQQFPF